MKKRDELLKSKEKKTFKDVSDSFMRMIMFEVLYIRLSLPLLTI